MPNRGITARISQRGRRRRSARWATLRKGTAPTTAWYSTTPSQATAAGMWMARETKRGRPPGEVPGTTLPVEALGLAEAWAGRVAVACVAPVAGTAVGCAAPGAAGGCAAGGVVAWAAGAAPAAAITI